MYRLQSTEKLSSDDMTSEKLLCFYLLSFERPQPLLLPQVADFGHSRPLLVTRSVDMRGTLLWTSPEVLAKERHSTRSDVWSFGCIAVEMFTEIEPYNHKHKRDIKRMDEVLEKVKNRKLVRQRGAVGCQ